ncbi:hypothetical protein Bealeia2_02075 (plasmid) [Candidatus Bealeia paramacronuclearis]|nr:hypothetical protein [Candidatus Bealeia paramacronuclearis]
MIKSFPIQWDWIRQQIVKENSSKTIFPLNFFHQN